MSESENVDTAKQIAAALSLVFETDSTTNSSADEWKCHCPLHRDRNPSMYINPTKLIYHCFQCGAGGSLYSLYKTITGKSYSTKPYDKFSIASTFLKKPITYDTEIKDPTTTISIEKCGSDIPVKNSPETMRYLRKRGISLDIAETMHMTYMHNGEINKTKFIQRLLIPIMEKGVCISIEGRDITGLDKRKVLYPKDSSVSTLYDIDNLQVDETLYVVEGLMDLAVLRSDPFFKNSTALFGSSISRRQIALLNTFKDIVVIPDNDNAGKKSLFKLKENLNKAFRILEVPNLGIKDVGDIGSKLHSNPKALRARGWGRTLKSSTSLIFAPILKESMV